jgi:hypothetical protein
MHRDEPETGLVVEPLHTPYLTCGHDVLFIPKFFKPLQGAIPVAK